MDYDSSTKFISSLAKFLQSLCNGYVEFDNGVEVIGHIYLSVDTGKKIDYILNEKVCKTDENSVTFISNSFHAQPAEKPKPNTKKGRTEQTEDKTESVVEIDNDGNNPIEPRSTNLGTIPRTSNRNTYSPSQRHGKRPFSPHSKSGSSPGSKRGRNGSQEYPSGLISDEGNLPTTSPAVDPLRGFTQGSTSLASEANFSQSYDQGFNPSVDNSFSGESEERDIKPTVDTDVTFVKEEFTPSSCSQMEDDRNQGLDASFSSMYPSNQSYSGGGPTNQGYGPQNSSRLSFGGTGERSDSYDPGMRSSHMEGSDGGADASASPRAICPLRSRRIDNGSVVSKASKKEYVGECGFCPDGFSEFGEFLEHIDIVDTPMSVCRGDTQVKAFHCGICNLSMDTVKDMREHLHQIHNHVGSFELIDLDFENNGSGRFPCYHCTKSYSDKKGLKRHLNALEGVYFKCSFCDKRYARQDILSAHMRRVHDLKLS